ncbi:MAG: TIGR03085 family protein [Actinobacteria bacterium]|nr:TIGR03085 family protein [Actinomycetota bacterium]
MSDPSFARSERHHLADAMLDLGADAQTLCEGWTNYDMAAHVVVRERKPLTGLGIMVPAFHSLHDNAIVKAKRRHSFQALVDKFRGGPPFTWKAVDGLFNTQEYFIHTEDVRRGPGDHTPRPEAEIADLEVALWKTLRRGAKLMARGIKGVGVDLVAPDGDVIHARTGSETVTIAGRPGEIVLYLAGRRSAAQVKLEGSPEAIAIAEGAGLGI